MFPGESEIDQLFIIQRVLGPLTRRQTESFLKNPKFVGLKFPDVDQPSERLERKYWAHLKATRDDFLSLMKAMLSLDPAKRPSATECLQHQFFDEVRTQVYERRVPTPTRRPHPVDQHDDELPRARTGHGHEHDVDRRLDRLAGFDRRKTPQPVVRRRPDRPPVTLSTSDQSREDGKRAETSRREHDRKPHNTNQWDATGSFAMRKSDPGRGQQHRSPTPSLPSIGVLRQRHGEHGQSSFHGGQIRREASRTEIPTRLEYPAASDRVSRAGSRSPDRQSPMHPFHHPRPHGTSSHGSRPVAQAAPLPTSHGEAAPRSYSRLGQLRAGRPAAYRMDVGHEGLGVPRGSRGVLHGRNRLNLAKLNGGGMR